MRTTRVVAALGVLGFGLLVGTVGACGGSSSSDLTSPADSGTSEASSNEAGDAGEAPYTLDDVCERTAPIICELRKSCCTSGPGYDEAGCLAHAKASCAKDVTAVREGRATFHGDRIPGCIPKYKAIYAEACVLTFDLLQKHLHDIATCETFEGQLPEGSTCEQTSDCKPGATKDDIVGCDDTTKKCKITTVVAENGACTLGEGLPRICDAGLYCDVDFGSDAGTLDGTCKKKTALGATCDKTKKPVSLECGLGNYCDQVTSTCVAGKTGNTPCSDNLECASVTCEKVGDAGTGTCKAESSLAKPEECKGP